MFCCALFREQSSHNQAYRTHIIDQLHNIEAVILRDYHHMQREVCLIIVVYVFRVHNQSFHALINGPLPTAVNPVPTRQDPPYADIVQHLLMGRIKS